MITRETAGRIVGIALAIALSFAVPFLVMSFICNSVAPADWGTVGRSFVAVFIVMEWIAYMIFRLPSGATDAERR